MKFQKKNYKKRILKRKTNKYRKKNKFKTNKQNFQIEKSKIISSYFVYLQILLKKNRGKFTCGCLKRER